MKTHTEALKTQLTVKQEALTLAQYKLSSFKDDPLKYFNDEITAAYDDRLQEQYGHLVEAVGFLTGEVADLMRDHDNTQYTLGLSDFADSYDCCSISEYVELEESIEGLEEEIEELQEELEDI